MASKPSDTSSKEYDPYKKVKLALGIGAAVFVALILIFGIFVVIPAGNRGVLLTFGKATATLGEGLNFKIPIVQDVAVMSVQTQKYEADASAASKDLQDVTTKVALNFHLTEDNVLPVYRDLGLDFASRIIQPAVQESVKASTAQFTAEELITKRPVVKEKIDAMLTERLGKYGIIVDTISITEFQFSVEFTKSIEMKVVAQQNALKAENDLQRIKVEAEQKIASAQAEAESLRLVNEQLKQSPLALQLRVVEKWTGQLPMYYVAGGGTNNLMTMLPLGTTPSAQ